MKCAFVNLGKHFGGAENYLLTIIKRWIEDGINISAKDLTKKYEILVTNSLDNIIHNLIK